MNKLIFLIVLCFCIQKVKSVGYCTKENGTNILYVHSYDPYGTLKKCYDDDYYDNEDRSTEFFEIKGDDNYNIHYIMNDQRSYHCYGGCLSFEPLYTEKITMEEN